VPGAARATAGTLATVVLLLFAAAQPASGMVKPSERGSPRVHAAPQLLWLVKSNDLRTLWQQARADGVTLPAFTWVGCGRPSDTFRCRAGQQPIFTDYRQLRARAEAGWLGTAVFDIEPWLYTPPAERKDPRKWICRAARLQQIDPYLQVIITPFARPQLTRMIGEDVAAARCGAYAVDIQTQFANGTPRQFAVFLRTAVRAIRSVNSRIVILTGLATNNPIVQTPAHLVTDYHRALAAGVQGFWLNAATWLAENQCTPADGGQGCPKVGLQFLAQIGLVTRGRADRPRNDFVQLALDDSFSKITGALAVVKATLARMLAGG
jgi:hypothetical protein